MSRIPLCTTCGKKTSFLVRITMASFHLMITVPFLMISILLMIMAALHMIIVLISIRAEVGKGNDYLVRTNGVSKNMHIVVDTE